MNETLDDVKGEHPRGDVLQAAFLVSFIVVWAGDSFFLRWTIFLSRYMPLYARLSILSAALVTAALLNRSGHSAVRDAGRPARVIESGAFRFVRHPMYLSSLLFYAGLTVASLSLVAAGMTVAIFIFFDHIAGFEERVMREKFGDKYEGYMERTGKWIPRIGAAG